MSQSLRYKIERAIDQWDGTIFGYQIKNMYENGQIDAVCEMLDLDPDEE